MGKILIVKLREKQDKHLTYHNKVNCDDFKQLAWLLDDLKREGVPIEKAVAELKKNQGEQFPW